MQKKKQTQRVTAQTKLQLLEVVTPVVCLIDKLPTGRENFSARLVLHLDTDATFDNYPISYGVPKANIM